MDSALGTEPRDDYLGIELTHAAHKLVREVRPVEPGLTIRDTPCDLAITATDLRPAVEIEKHSPRVGYELHEIGRPDLADLVCKAFPS